MPPMAMGPYAMPAYSSFAPLQQHGMHGPPGQKHFGLPQHVTPPGGPVIKSEQMPQQPMQGNGLLAADGVATLLSRSRPVLWR